MNSKNTWLTLEEVCELMNDRKETIRRKCKSEQFVSKFEQKGKFKQYYVLLTSLPEVIQKKYLKNNKEIDIAGIDAIKYSDAPVWSKKQADKYIELINLTDNLKRSKVEKVIDEWNKQHPEKQVAYSTLMDNLMQNRTVFIIAHRLSTIKNADRIAVINEGELVEIGKHDELMQIENGQYKHLYEMQFKKQDSGASIY